MAVAGPGLFQICWCNPDSVTGEGFGGPCSNDVLCVFSGHFAGAGCTQPSDYIVNAGLLEMEGPTGQSQKVILLGDFFEDCKPAKLA